MFEWEMLILLMCSETGRSLYTFFCLKQHPIPNLKPQILKSQFPVFKTSAISDSIACDLYPLVSERSSLREG